MLRLAVRALLVAVDLAWLAGWSVVVGALVGVGGPALGAGEILGLLVLGALASRVAVRRLTGGRLSALERGLLGAIGVVVCGAVGALTLPSVQAGADLATIGAEFVGTIFGPRAALATVFSLVIWWRGIAAGQAVGAVYEVESRARGGVIALALALTVAIFGGIGGSGAGGVTTGLVGAALLLLGAALVALPLSRVAEVSEHAGRRGGRPVTPSGPWLALLGGIVTAILLLALLFAWVFTFERIGTLLAPLGALLWLVLSVFLLPIAYLVDLLVRQIPRANPPPTSTIPAMPARLDLSEQLRDQATGAGLSPALVTTLEVLGALLVLAALVWLLARSIRRPVSPTEEGLPVEEERELVWSWPGFRAGWRMLLEWLRGARPEVAEPETDLAPVLGEADTLAGLGIRDLYRVFLGLGVAAGRSRQAVETPHEYARRLAADESLPGEDEVAAVTAGYVRARYDAPRRAPTTAEVGTVRRAVERLRALWRGG